MRTWGGGTACLLLLAAVYLLLPLLPDPGEGMPRRMPGVQQFFMSEEDGANAFWATAVIQPGLLLLIGLAIVARRRFW